MISALLAVAAKLLLSVRWSRTQRRLGLSLFTGAVTGTFTFVVWGYDEHASDFGQLWAGAKALLDGQSPYEVVGPGKLFEWEFPLLYPLPAVLFSLPFTLAPLRLADSLMTGLGAAALAWAITRDRLTTAQWWVFASMAYVTAWHVVQWSPLLVAAALTPSLGVLLACKPTLGAALWIAFPERRSLLGAAGLALVSLLVLPSWPLQWIDAVQSSTSHVSVPLTHVSAGGPLALLALLRWRRSDARLLAALACIPQTTLLYEAVPLFLIVRRWYEGLALTVLTVFAHLRMPERGDSYDAWVWGTGDQMVFWLYLPCLAMVLLRENEGLTWDWTDWMRRRFSRSPQHRAPQLS